jgi:hypothetical protein
VGLSHVLTNRKEYRMDEHLDKWWFNTVARIMAIIVVAIVIPLGIIKWVWVKLGPKGA